MKGIMATIMLNCEQASLLTIKKEKQQLGLIDQMRLWMHTKACHLCKEFSSQNDFININLKYHFQDADEHIQKMSESKKSELKKALTKEQV